MKALGDSGKQLISDDFTSFRTQLPIRATKEQIETLLDVFMAPVSAEEKAEAHNEDFSDVVRTRLQNLRVI